MVTRLESGFGLELVLVLGSGPQLEVAPGL